MKNTFLNIHQQISLISDLSREFEGFIDFNSQKIDTVIDKNGTYKIQLNRIIPPDNESFHFKFSNESLNLFIDCYIHTRNSTINVSKQQYYQYSRGIINNFKSIDFKATEKSLYRSFYKIRSSNFFLTYFDDTTYNTETHSSRGLLSLRVNGFDFSVYTYHNDYLIIESNNVIDYDVFSEINYNILVAIGFVSGKFIQDEVYVFKDVENKGKCPFCYNKLRNSSYSIYHAVTRNPYGYKKLIGSELANNLYDNNTLRPFTSENLSNLTELIKNNNQVQYALVLFNEANASNLSLLVKNNSFYVVLEVLKKFFHPVYQKQLPKNYSNRSNTDKYVLLFNCIIPISKDDEQVLDDRNCYLHGDIKNLDDEKMLKDMQKQITFIYRLILTYIGFKGLVIDHYSLRNNGKENAFIKCE